MALQGEGDPRWVVREREDGRNVNSWHWTDKDVSSWAHARVKELISSELCAPPVRGEHDGVHVEEIETVEGDATLYNRKGTLKVLYDLKVKGKWASNHDAKEDRTTGTFNFELFDEEPEIVVSIDSGAKAEGVYKGVFTKVLIPKIREKCSFFIAELHAGANTSVDGLVLAKKKTKKEEPKVTDYLRSGMNQAPKPSQEKKDKSTTELVLRDEFVCSTSDMFLALTDKPRLEAITRAKAISNAKVGGELNLMNGTVKATYTTLERGRKIGMKWRLNTWDDTYEASDVDIVMTEADGKCMLEVVLRVVPTKFKTETEGFWRVQIFQSVKVVMGYGRASSFF